VLPGADAVAFVDVDDTMRQTYGHAKQGTGYGYTGVKGLNALIATVSTPTGAPLVAATRLRKGSCTSARGAASLIGASVRTARACGASGLLIVRADSAFYNAKTIAAVTRSGARFSVTARRDKAVTRAIAAIPEKAWVPIRYPNAVFDPDQQRWISDAEVAETTYTAFTKRPAREQVTARLIVRRVKRLHPNTVKAGQDGLFEVYRHHAVFTDSPITTLAAETQHRGHAIIETVIADLKAGPLAHLPSGRFNANAAWLVLATISYNLLRAAGALASTFHANATTATIRRHLIGVPARIARSARRLTLHLPEHWPWQHPWRQLYDNLTHPA
jgi:hypothetical protein